MDNKKLTAEEIIHIAKLANLTLKNEEIEKFQSQLSSILDYIEKLQEVATKNTKETSQVTGLENIYCEDVSKTSLSQQDAISNAQKEKNGTFSVKAIF